MPQLYIHIFLGYAWKSIEREREREGEYRDNMRKWRSNGFDGEIWKYTQNDDKKAGTSGTIRNN